MKLRAIDVNCDMGEGFGHWSLGDADDKPLMAEISSANIATGFHAGDPGIMDKSVRLAAQNKVAVGAHPGYRDLQGFGRRKIAASSEEIINDIVYQVGAMREFAERHGLSLHHVKPHGALYMEMADNKELSERFIETMRQVAPACFVYCMGESATYRAATAMGQPVIREFFADRNYGSSGRIVFERRMGVIDPAAVAAKSVRACRENKVATQEGEDIDIAFESICFHSDTPGSLAIARALSSALRDEGIAIEAPSPSESPEKRE